MIAGEGAQLIEQNVGAGEIPLLLGAVQRVDQAAGQPLAYGDVIGIIAGEGAQLIEQGVAAGEIPLLRGAVHAMSSERNSAAAIDSPVCSA